MKALWLKEGKVAWAKAAIRGFAGLEAVMRRVTGSLSELVVATQGMPIVQRRLRYERRVANRMLLHLKRPRWKRKLVNGRWRRRR